MRVEITEWGSVTHFDDGGELVAAPEPTDDYEERARDLGYASGLEMCQSHDWIHCLIGEVLGRTSPALWAAAHACEERDHAAIGEDEAMALEFGKWTNGRVEAPWLFLAKWKAAILSRTRGG